MHWQVQDAVMVMGLWLWLWLWRLCSTSLLVSAGLLLVRCTRGESSTPSPNSWTPAAIIHTKAWSCSAQIWSVLGGVEAFELFTPEGVPLLIGSMTCAANGA